MQQSVEESVEVEQPRTEPPPIETSRTPSQTSQKSEKLQQQQPEEAAVLSPEASTSSTALPTPSSSIRSSKTKTTSTQLRNRKVSNRSNSGSKNNISNNVSVNNNINNVVNNEKENVFVPKSSDFLSTNENINNNNSNSSNDPSTFIPNPQWFAEGNRSREDFVRLMSGANHASNLLSNSSASHSHHHHHTPSSSSSRNATPGRPSSGVLQAHQHDEVDSTAMTTKKTTPSRRRTTSPLQRSLDALRRRQAIRMALEEGVAADEELSPDYWNSPNHLHMGNRRPMTMSSEVFEEEKREILMNNNNSSSNGNSARRRRPQHQEQENLIEQEEEEENNSKSFFYSSFIPESVKTRYRAFKNTQDFGEELFFNVLYLLGQIILEGIWLLGKNIIHWSYRILYFILFDKILPQNRNNKTDGNNTENENEKEDPKLRNVFGFPSPFPSVYRDAFFSTWSPHELLEPPDLPMTNPFLPTPLPSTSGSGSSSQKQAEMLRPVPSPPFWWLALMEISGRHYIEINAMRELNNVYLEASKFERMMWLLHEDEVIRGGDLIRHVTQGQTKFVVDNSTNNMTPSSSSQNFPPSPFSVSSSQKHHYPSLFPSSSSAARPLNF